MKSSTGNSQLATGSHSRLICLGVITSPHGIRGQVKIRSFTADPEDITAYGPLADASGRAYDITITSYTKDVLIASVAGVSTREDAEKLRNTELFVPRSALPAPTENEYYHEDLVGLNVTTKDGQPFGTIAAIHNFGAGDLVAVTLSSGKEEFIPFTRATFPRIDIANGVAVIDPPVLLETDRQEESNDG